MKRRDFIQKSATAAAATGLIATSAGIGIMPFME